MLRCRQREYGQRQAASQAGLPPSVVCGPPPPPQAAVVAIANIYYGMIHIYDGLGAWAWASYTAVLLVIVGTSVAKDTSDFLR